MFFRFWFFMLSAWGVDCLYLCFVVASSFCALWKLYLNFGDLLWRFGFRDSWTMMVASWFLTIFFLVLLMLFLGSCFVTYKLLFICWLLLFPPITGHNWFSRIVSIFCCRFHLCGFFFMSHGRVLLLLCISWFSFYFSLFSSEFFCDEVILHFLRHVFVVVS